MDNKTSQHVDILIVGAGMVGSALACSIISSCEKPPKIMVVEPSKVLADEKAYQPGFDVRSTALSAGSKDWFQSLGLWNELKSKATAIKHIHVSDQGKFGSARMNADELNVDALGYVVENPWLGRVLNNALVSQSNCSLKDRCQIESLESLEEGVLATLRHLDNNEREEIQCGLLVLAEGGRSGLAESLGINRFQKPYSQTAVIANVVTEKSHHKNAYERFTEKGPLALLPLTTIGRENRCALIWTQDDEDIADELMQCSGEEFLERLQLDFGFRMGRFTKVGERKSFPLSLVTTQEQVRQGVVLLGNAAHTLHPVAGQGFNLSLRDVLALTEVIVKAQENNKPFGSLEVLKQYQDLVDNDQFTTVSFSDYLTRLFSSDGTLSRVGRKAGLLGIDMFPSVKKRLTRQAMGVGGRKPALKIKPLAAE